jgi:type II secretory pathway component GspD/PulD (secretin)
LPGRLPPVIRSALSPSAARRNGAAFLCAAGLVLGCLATPVRSEEPTPAAPPETAGPSHISYWLDEKGGVEVGDDGLARGLFQPEFRDAPSLQARLVHHGLKGLTIQAMPPFVAVPPPKKGARAPAPIPSRLLLLSKDPALVARGLYILRRLDVGPRSAFVSILASEVTRASREESGGSLLYDRRLGSDPSNTIFRGFSTSFEPDSFLRSSLTGVTPFQGTSLSFGDLDAGGGLFAYSLRMLSHVGSSQFIAWPNLVVSEGHPAEMQSLRVVPQAVLLSSKNDSIRYDSTQEVGIKLRLTPIRIGKDSAVLDLDVWLRIPGEVNDASAVVGSVRLKLRQVRTRITLYDREPLLLGGLVLRQRDRSRRGMPRPKELEVLDPLHSALSCGNQDTEVCFLIRMRSVTPGRAPTEMKPTVYRGWSRGETRTDPFGR